MVLLSQKKNYTLGYVGKWKNLLPSSYVVAACGKYSSSSLQLLYFF